MEDHLKVCRVGSPDVYDNLNASITTNGTLPNEGVTHFSDNTAEKSKWIDVDQNINALRSALHEEIKQRHRLISDVGDIRRQNIMSDEWVQKINDVLDELKKCLGDETKNRETEVKHCRDEIDRVERQYEVGAYYVIST